MIFLFRSLSAILDHPSYTSSPTENYDYSLLRLSSGLDWSSNSHIRPVCLPEPGDSYSVGDPMVVTGQVLVSIIIIYYSLSTILFIWFIANGSLLLFLAGNQLYERSTHRRGCGCQKKSIAIFTYKQRLLSIDMKTKVVQHVPRIN